MHCPFGGQLGPRLVTPGEGGPGRVTPLLMIEARPVLWRRRLRRAKASGDTPPWITRRQAAEAHAPGSSAVSAGVGASASRHPAEALMCG